MTQQTSPNKRLSHVPGVSDVCMVGTGIIVHQNKFLTDRTRIWPHKLIENPIAIPQCRQCSVFNCIQVSFPLTLMTVMFYRIQFTKSLFGHSLHQLTPISKIETESGLISEEHCHPVTNSPSDVNSGKVNQSCTCWLVNGTRIAGLLAFTPNSRSLFLTVCVEMHSPVPFLNSLFKDVAL